MSHTFSGEGCRIHYDLGDLTGEVHIYLFDGQEFGIPLEDILGFTSNMLKQEMIKALEDDEPYEIITGQWKERLKEAFVVK